MERPSEDSATTDYQRIHNYPNSDLERCRPLRDDGGVRGPEHDGHCLPVEAQRVIPDDRGRAHGRLNSEQHNHRREVFRPRWAQYEDVQRREERKTVAVLCPAYRR